MALARYRSWRASSKLYRLVQYLHPSSMREKKKNRTCKGPRGPRGISCATFGSLTRYQTVVSEGKEVVTAAAFGTAIAFMRGSYAYPSMLLLVEQVLGWVGSPAIRGTNCTRVARPPYTPNTTVHCCIRWGALARQRGQGKGVGSGNPAPKSVRPRRILAPSTRLGRPRQTPS